MGNMKCDDYATCNCRSRMDTLNGIYCNGLFCLEAGGQWAKFKKDYECHSPLHCLDRISRCSNELFISTFLRSDSAVSKYSQTLSILLFTYKFFDFFPNKHGLLHIN